MSTNNNSSILFVHGRNFKPAEEALMEVSLSALRSGVRRDYPDSVDAGFDAAGEHRTTLDFYFGNADAGSSSQNVP